MVKFDDSEKWRVKKEISLGDVIAIVVAMGTVLVAYGKLDTRVSLIEAHATVQLAIDAKQDETHRSMVVDLRERLNSIDSKLDRVIEGRRK